MFSLRTRPVGWFSATIYTKYQHQTAPPPTPQMLAKSEERILHETWIGSESDGRLMVGNECNGGWF